TRRPRRKRGRHVRVHVPCCQARQPGNRSAAGLPTAGARQEPVCQVDQGTGDREGGGGGMTLMDLDRVFARVEAHLRKKKIKTTFKKKTPAKKVSVDKAAKAIGLPFPKELQQFYLEYADGLLFFWDKEDEQFGCLYIPPVAELAKNYGG